MQETGTRINKYMSQCGYCSRREADRLIDKGEVWINGTLATMGTKVIPGDTVMVHHTTITPCQKEYLLAFHKPAGIVCTTSKIDKNNVIDYLNFPERIYPVGRLDKESTGLLLLTNNGQLMDDVLRGSNYHEKEYIVHVNKPITDIAGNGAGGTDFRYNNQTMQDTPNGKRLLLHYINAGIKPSNSSNV